MHGREDPKTRGSETQSPLLGGCKKLGQFGFSSNTPCCKEVEIKCSQKKNVISRNQSLNKLKSLLVYQHIVGSLVVQVEATRIIPLIGENQPF